MKRKEKVLKDVEFWKLIIIILMFLIISIGYFSGVK